MRGLGWIPDPPSASDFDAAEHLKALPIPYSASNRDLVPAIIDQGQLGSCTANATAYALRAAMMLVLATMGITEVPELVSRLFLYYLARATQGGQNVDSGTWLRLIFEVLNKFGFCPESVWPYSDSTLGQLPPFTQLPTHHAFAKAFDQRAPTEYRRIFETGYARIDVIKQAISQRHLVVFGTPVSKQFCQGAFDPTVALNPPNDADIAGGHAMALAAYDGDDFDIPNSWGVGFGDGGWVKFSADYLAWAQSNDFWIVSKAPVYQAAA